jgi:CheY-like chemotaxis protein
MTHAKCRAILVVEDEADIREAIVEFLRADGFVVEHAHDGLEALVRLPRMPQPTLILADLMMPIMDGHALIAALRADDRFATLPVVVVSAVDAATPDAYRRLKKPIDLDDLASIVRELCGERT